ncbi:unnamed protein product [Prorocentrum cordatum]|uniref:Subtilisin n=1 Tax=Prorocentrum cordatum TaxID=2364126 RepID=A0ABN9WFU5_9DINO|nr:unnamed protein product [Polarella glacialis]
MNTSQQKGRRQVEAADHMVKGTFWSQVGQDIDGEAAGDWSGFSVSLSSDGSRVAIGAPYNDGAGTNSGHVRVFELSGNTWSQVGQDIDGEAQGDYSDVVSLSSDGSRVAIGAVYNDGAGAESGHVRVFELSGNIWSQVGQDIDGEASDDHSGFSVSLSSDGRSVAIGAPYNDGAGTNSGHVRVFELSGNTWSQVGQDIDGEASADQSGFSVSLSSDGSRVAIGAPWIWANPGHARVFGTEPASPADSPTPTPTAPPTSSPTPSPTEAPTSSPTSSPTASPTTRPTSAPAAPPINSGPMVKDIGDPHLANTLGQKFDLLQAGYHTLVQIPRWQRHRTNFLVEARASRAGRGCADLYFTEINISGTWARGHRATGLRWDAEATRLAKPAWMTFHNEVKVKTVHGRTA